MRRFLSLALILIMLILIIPVSAEDRPALLSKVKVNIPIKDLESAPPPLILGSKVIVVSGRGLSAVSAYSISGKLLWTKKLGSRVYYLVGVEPNLIVFLKEKALILSSKNGAPLGTIKLDSPPSAQPLYDLSINELFLPTESGYMEAMSGLSMRTLWKKKLDSPPIQVLDAGAEVVAVTQQKAYCFLKSGGSKLWESEVKDIEAAGIGSGYVAILTKDHKLVYLDILDGNKKAELSLPSTSFPPGSLAVNENSVFLVSLGGGIYRFSEMKLVDKGFLGMWPVSQPLRVEDLLFTLGSDGRMEVLEARFGKTLWSLNLGVSPTSKISASSEGGFVYLCLFDKEGELLTIKTPLVKFSGRLEITNEREVVASGELTLLTSDGGSVSLYALDPLSNKTISASLGKLIPSFSKHVEAKISVPKSWPAVLVGFSVNDRRLGPLLNKTYTIIKPNKTKTNASKTNVTEKGTLEMFVKEASFKIAVGAKETVSVKVTNTLDVNTFLVDVSSSGKVIKVLNSPNVLIVNKGGTAYLNVEVLAISPGTDALKVALKSGNSTFEKTLTFKVSRTTVVQGMTISKFRDIYLLDVRMKNTVQDNATYVLSVYANEKKVATVKVPMAKKGEERSVKVQLPIKENKFDVVAVVEVNGIRVQVARKTFSLAPQQLAFASLGLVILAGVAVVAVGAVAALILMRRKKVRKPKVVQPPIPEEVQVPGLEERPPEKPSIEHEEMPTLRVEPPSEKISTPETVISGEEREEKPPSAVEMEEKIEERPALEEREEEETIEEKIAGVPSLEELYPPVEERPRAEEVEVSKPEVKEEVQRPETVPSEEKVEMEEELPLERIEFGAPEEEGSLAEILDLLKEIGDRLNKLMESERRIRRELDLDEPLFEPQLKEISEAIESVRASLRAGDLRRAREELNKISESLDAIETKMKSGERILVNNWDIVEKRIEVMLRVWGRAPATMITMVPQEFRVIALKIYMKKHPEAKWELVGDELRRKE